MAKTKRKVETDKRVVYQLKITLLGIQPPIWRRIQVADCTLDRLHEAVQTAMGWTNRHLHQFEIDGMRYGDPQLLDDGFGELECEDSLATRLSKLLGRRKKGFRFRYEYDFGDGWEHEIQLEDQLPAEPKTKYPQCVDGARACPPEDCGGVWGYADLLKVLGNSKHKEYERLSEWAGQIDPEAFNPRAATATMHEGIFDWRSEAAE